MRVFFTVAGCLALALAFGRLFGIHDFRAPDALVSVILSGVIALVGIGLMIGAVAFRPVSALPMAVPGWQPPGAPPLPGHLPVAGQPGHLPAAAPPPGYPPRSPSGPSAYPQG